MGEFNLLKSNSFNIDDYRLVFEDRVSHHKSRYPTTTYSGYIGNDGNYYLLCKYPWNPAANTFKYISEASFNFIKDKL